MTNPTAADKPSAEEVADAIAYFEKVIYPMPEGCGIPAVHGRRLAAHVRALEGEIKGLEASLACARVLSEKRKLDRLDLEAKLKAQEEEISLLKRMGCPECLDHQNMARTGCLCCRFQERAENAEAEVGRLREEWNEDHKFWVDKAVEKDRELSKINAEWKEISEKQQLQIKRLNRVVQVARAYVEKEHSGWDAAHTPPGDPCKLCEALSELGRGGE